MRSRVRRRDGGFTLVELVVAMSLILVITGSSLTALVRTLGTVTGAKQRQAASTLATAALEQLRALPYATTTAGLRADDLAGDPHVTTGPGGPRLTLAAAGIDQPLVTAGGAQTPAPLYPHVSTATVDGIPFSSSVYVTRDPAAEGAYTLTVAVRWSSAVTRGPRLVVQRSAVFSPEGCLSPATHPYSGPCQGMFTGEAGTSAAQVWVAHPTDARQPVAGFGGTRVQLALPRLSTSLALEQTAVAAARTTTSGGSATGAATVSTGASVAGATGSTDPTAGSPAVSAAATPPQAAGSSSVTGTLGTLTATPAGGDAGTAFAAATGADSRCADTSGTATAAGQTCGAGVVRSAGSDAVLRADLTGTAAVRAVPAFDLARLAPWPADARAVTARLVAGTANACPTAAGEGCTHGAVTRRLGTVTLGALPAPQAGDSRPAAFTTAVSVTGLSESARAEVGTGERPPTYTRTGTLSYWNGTGYSQLDLAAATPPAVDPPPVLATYPGSGGSVTVSVDAAVVVGSAATTSTGTLPCPAGCNRSVTGSQITVSLEYVVTVAGTERSRFRVTADLGSLVARAGHTGAPGA